MPSTTLSNRWVLLARDDRQQPLQLIRPSRWDRLLARLRSHTLDRQLADGLSADSNRLRAVRASVLVTPCFRQAQAGYWQLVLTTATRPRRPADPALPLPRARILKAQPQIDLLMERLRSPGPVSARGVASANLLLVDGVGPVRNRLSRVDLRAAIQTAIDHLDPRTELCPR